MFYLPDFTNLPNRHIELFQTSAFSAKKNLFLKHFGFCNALSTIVLSVQHSFELLLYNI